ncbi:hypothetical protein F511_05848 [Dorcoceras hygrometricum]|uniref:Uncharacterized protein n=1 Tax=Dorcoceras hygrometricum TaxID=472368 RepID=A0A2Z7CWP2_9LAMI|nr:hypothetical protein F511_05848 [Dorcoceras hygrometricum]
MAQYQILARKLLGPPGTGPKQTLEVKNGVATPPRVRRTAAAQRRPPPAQHLAHCRTLRAARPAIGTVAARSYIAVVRTLQCRHSIGYPRIKASGESSTTKYRLLHASGPHPIPPPNDPNRVGKRVKVRRLSCRVSMTFRVVRTNQYNQDLGLIHSTNGNHLESPNEGSSIDHQVTIHLHAQNITMFPTNETWYFTS